MSSSPVLTGAETAQPKLDILSEVGLTPFEGARVRELVGREPNALEWAMFGAMWSEHCAYKHSKKLLRTLPTKGARVALGPGENAGAVDLEPQCAAGLQLHRRREAAAAGAAAADGHVSAVAPVELQLDRRHGIASHGVVGRAGLEGWVQGRRRGDRDAAGGSRGGRCHAGARDEYGRKTAEAARS